MDMRDKTELTYNETMIHLNKCFSNRVFHMMYDAINKEIERQKEMQSQDAYHGA